MRILYRTRTVRFSVPYAYGIGIRVWYVRTIGGGKGGARGLKPPLSMISHRNYLSWSGAENRDKDRDTLIEQSL